MVIWFGRSCYDVYRSEFRNMPPEHHYAKIMQHKMKLVKNPNSRTNFTVYEGSQLLELIKIGPGDKIVHYEHVHEPPVLNTLPQCIYEDESCYVVDKPAGVPVHPVKNYFYNTVMSLIYNERPDLEPLYPVHRLDKVTSGVLMFCKDQTTVSLFKQMMRNKSVAKTYLARVSGVFPERTQCDDPIVYIYGARKEVKQFEPAKTVFAKLFYDSITDESVIECHPISGFPHQIRIHLRNLGFPIIQDYLYRDKYTEVFRQRSEVTSEYLDSLYMRSMKQRQSMESMENCKCPECQTTLYKDPSPQSLAIKLHSLRYSLWNEDTNKQWKFETQIPSWAKPSH
ncbi:hypothetical protein FOA43_002811 [Brettanomyces nanus]|uniref:Pseudouridine synthase RsuA/RluA-like domain-containing protein n=1 Tax=Eeniella nana TaxID=13502 RepID=A0A875S287_EENNA|nr:uncharacterized protein FOA43_002811 [Brettanomyces nanus]QPG75456.1 hypothetical protein FOA43_002811 [Brettanomyces nanus]